VVFQNVGDKSKKEIIQAKLLMAEGELQIEGEVIHVIVQQCFDISKMLFGFIHSQRLANEIPGQLNPDATNDETRTKKVLEADLKQIPGARNFK